MCIALCTIAAHNIAQNRPDHHHISDDVYLREGGSESGNILVHNKDIITTDHSQELTYGLLNGVTYDYLCLLRAFTHCKPFQMQFIIQQLTRLQLQHSVVQSLCNSSAFCYNTAPAKVAAFQKSSGSAQLFSHNLFENSFNIFERFRRSWPPRSFEGWVYSIFKSRQNSSNKVIAPISSAVSALLMEANIR